VEVQTDLKRSKNFPSNGFLWRRLWTLRLQPEFPWTIG